MITIAFVACADRRAPQLAVSSCGSSIEVRGAEYHGVIFPPDCRAEIYHVGRDRIAGYWLPSPNEISILEAGLRPALEQSQVSPVSIDPLSNSPERAAYVSREIGGTLDRLGRYRRQYAGITLGDGRHRILVNFFPSATPGEPDSYGYWTRRWVSVDDGGNWYWRIQYELGSARFVEFDVNGYA